MKWFGHFDEERKAKFIQESKVKSKRRSKLKREIWLWHLPFTNK